MTTGSPQTPGRPRFSPGLVRITLIAASLIYAAAMHYAHIAFLNPVWGYYGFTLVLPSAFDYVLMFGLAGLAGAVLPARLGRPSSIVVLALYLTVYIPTVTLTLAAVPDAGRHYGPALGALGAGFALVCLLPRWVRDVPVVEGRPGPGFSLLTLAAWVVACGLLVVMFASIMTFATGRSIYEQRAIGTDTSMPIAYLQTYFANVIGPAVLALGLVRRSYAMIGAGLLGALVLYLITAQRLTLMVPFLIIALDVVLTRRRAWFRSVVFATAGFAALVFVTALIHDDNAVGDGMAHMLLFRSLGLPGLTFSQYYDLFARDGFTWWSHVRGIGAVVPPPEAFAQDPLWPMLGRLIGDRVYGSNDLNANANLFSGDGAAAAGAFGVLCISAVLAIYLVLLDLAARGWQRRFVLLVTLPVALILTNGHLSTTLLSYGGLFWLAVFAFSKPGRRPP